MKLQSIYDVITGFHPNSRFTLYTPPTYSHYRRTCLAELQKKLSLTHYQPLKVIISEVAYAHMPIDWPQALCDQMMVLTRGQRDIGVVRW